MNTDTSMENELTSERRASGYANEDEPWYKNQWVWLIIAIPSLTVLGCAFTIYLALTNPDYLVNDAPSESTSPASQTR